MTMKTYPALRGRRTVYVETSVFSMGRTLYIEYDDPKPHELRPGDSGYEPLEALLSQPPQPRQTEAVRIKLGIWQNKTGTIGVSMGAHGIWQVPRSSPQYRPLRTILEEHGRWRT